MTRTFFSNTIISSPCKIEYYYYKVLVICKIEMGAGTQ